MIPFKGKSSLKQYISSTHQKYGYKVFVMCSNKGIINDFELHTGRINPPTDGPDLGESSNIVLRLSKVIPVQKNTCFFRQLVKLNTFALPTCRI